MLFLSDFALIFFFFAIISFKLLYSFFSIKSTIKIVVCCCSCCCNRLRALIYSIQELVAIAYDAVQIIKQAQNIEPCLSINGSAVTSEDRDALFSCMTKVKLNQLFWASADRKIVVRVFQYVLIFLPFPYFFFSSIITCSWINYAGKPKLSKIPSMKSFWCYINKKKSHLHSTGKLWRYNRICQI